MDGTEGMWSRPGAKRVLTIRDRVIQAASGSACRSSPSWRLALVRIGASLR
jgi:hypothetical protein